MLSGVWYYDWDYWKLYHKVTFDGINKLIIVNYGVTELDVKVDVYSAWKEWAQMQKNLQFPPAFTAIGGEAITNDSFLGSTFFLENGWRVKMWEGHHILNVVGNLYTREPGGDPYISPDGDYKVTISTVRSSLVSTVVAGSGLSAEESLRLLELWKLAGLDRATPLVVSPTKRVAGTDIAQTINRSNDDPSDQTVTVSRDD